MAGEQKTKTWVWVVVAVGVGSCALCTVSALGLGALGFLASDEEASGSALVAATGGGGFTLRPPAPFTEASPGRYTHQWSSNEAGDDAETYSVEVIRLPPVQGMDDPHDAVVRLWTTELARDWKKYDDAALDAPVVMRRFVQNGARAWFAASELRAQGTGRLFLLTLLLVEADDHLEPLVILQGATSTSSPLPADSVARYSWAKSQPLVEAFLTGVEGSPTGRPLLSDEELLGRWRYGTGRQRDWVNPLTREDHANSVGYTMHYEFSDDHRFTWRYDGQRNSINVHDGEAAEGRWAIEHDVLVLTPDEGSVRRFLLVGAPRRNGVRGLHLYLEPWDLLPTNLRSRAQVFVAE